MTADLAQQFTVNVVFIVGLFLAAGAAAIPVALVLDRMHPWPFGVPTLVGYLVFASALVTTLVNRLV